MIEGLIGVLRRFQIISSYITKVSKLPNQGQVLANHDLIICNVAVG